MALGVYGTTLNDELNRLANGGTYRLMSEMVDQALAAKQWAISEGITPYSTDTVGILNEIAGNTDKSKWLDFNGVCNQIASTTGLPAAAALRQYESSGAGWIASNAAYYIDSIYPTNWGSLGYVNLIGASNNYLSTPDATALDITGDIDVRCQVALDDWTPASINALVSKYGTSANQRAYVLYINTTGTVGFSWSANGTNDINTTSTTSTGITDGTLKWIRATLDVNNGAGTPQYEVKFYTSDDGTTWTQLGSTVTGITGPTSIFNSTAAVEIGAQNNGANSASSGKFYRAQIFAGLDGTDKRLDVNIATDYKSSNLDTFTATTGQTIAVFGTTINTINNLGTAGSLLPTTLGSSTAADSNDPKFLDHTGTNYVYVPGGSDNRLSIADSAALDITGDIDIRAYIALDSLVNTRIIEKTVTNFSYKLEIISGTNIRFSWSPDGTSAITRTASVAAPIVPGVPVWIRATLDVDNGSSQNVTTFYTSTDGTTWTQLGTNTPQAGTTSIYAGVGEVRCYENTAAGKLFRAQIFNGIDGTKVLDVDTSVITAGSATSFTAVTGQTVTINRSTSGRKTVAVTQPTWLFGTDDYMEVNNRYMSSGTYLYLPGVASNSATTPDSAAISITGDLDLRIKVALDDWTPGAINHLITKRVSATNQQSFFFQVNTNGTLQLWFYPDGTTANGRTSTVATGVADGATKWVRVTLDVDNGASGNDTKFWLSDDGTTWTQLGTTITGAGTTSIFDSTADLAIGVGDNGSLPARGKFFRAQVLNGIDGTVAFDANFETSITSLLQTSFTESSANAATVTINRSGSAYRSAGITTAGYLYPGATNTFAESATDFLNFGAADSFTVMAVARNFATLGTNDVLVSKKDSTTNTVKGYLLSNGSTTAAQGQFQVGDGTAGATAVSGSRTAGDLVTVTAVRNVTSDNLTVYNNGTAGTPVTDATTTAPSFYDTLRIARLGLAGTEYNDAEIYAVAVFRKALTASEISNIANYFTSREA